MYDRDMEGDTNNREDILSRWNNFDLSFAERDELLQEIETMKLYPNIMKEIDEWESEAGLYPDTDDPRFAEKLMRKQEFAENKQESIQQQMDNNFNPCDPDNEFELTPVQRFIGRFLSPQCPYLSALLYHGVGVGKTCAAITVAENYLRAFPRQSVIIVAPRNIQPGFRRTIFDDESLKISKDGPNEAKGCTGNTYLKKAGVEFERDRGIVVRRISALIGSRYTFLGYIQFHRMIEDIVKGVSSSLDEKARRVEQARLLRREFTGRLVIIDEAHNLRDTPAAADDDTDNPGGDMELSESHAAKKLTPSLIKVLDASEGLKLVLLSGTPMYNSYREIIFLLKLLLMNDKKTILSESDIFLPDGNFKPANPIKGTKSGEELLGAAANAYVSFMRGENPLSFPVRLVPQGTPSLDAWPTRDPKGGEIPDADRGRLLRLPFVPIEFEGASAETYQRISEDALEAGIGVGSIDEMVQSGNWLFPGEGGQQIRDIGFNSCFQEITGGGSIQFTSKLGPPTWLRADMIGTASPKAKFTIERARNATGIVFIYSRFIRSGALPLALALEANGYTPWGDKRPLLTDGNQIPEGRQCALCPRREKKHLGADHKFVPAKYILITGNSSISLNNPVAIQASRLKSNMDGRDVKIIIGSQVASEGVDFRFVREIYIFDSWFHLNKMEQVLGRGIRTCSHSLLSPEFRNCTTYLLLNTFGADQDTETADMYMYRRALKKAIEVGRVTRVLKRYALDCNLNRDAIIVSGLSTQRHIDSQGTVREEVDINDTKYTNLCDWLETCEYTCNKPIDINLEEKEFDMSTYDEYASQWRESEIKSTIGKLFKNQPQFQLEDIVEIMSSVPKKALSGILSSIVGNQSFRIHSNGIEGYLVYRNGYFLFQPDYLSDISIPLALRVADVPIKRDAFNPTPIQLKTAATEATATATTEVGVPTEEDEASDTEEEADSSENPLFGYWAAITGWAGEIINGQARNENIAEEVIRAINSRYTGQDEQNREKAWLSMIIWMYDHIQTSQEYPTEQKVIYRRSLAKTLIELIWDESLRPKEQLEILSTNNEIARLAAGEQLIRIGETQAFRYIDVMTGELKYICGTTACSEAVTRVFETSTSDPMRSLKSNTDTTGSIYGFIVPKAKERRLVFKTSNPVPPGRKVGKGGECSIVSAISHHIQMLKEISNLLVAEGYPRFILTEDVLDEKVRKRKEKEEAKTAGRAYSATKSSRTFENAVKACALKNIILRWMTIMQNERGGRVYFYRPIAALKTGHIGNLSRT